LGSSFPIVIIIIIIIIIIITSFYHFRLACFALGVGFEPLPSLGLLARLSCDELVAASLSYLIAASRVQMRIATIPQVAVRMACVLDAKQESIFKPVGLNQAVLMPNSNMI
jgi:hypothetical protein